MAGQKARSAVFTSQSIASAVCLGAFLTLLFYLLSPHLVTHSGRQTSDIIVSALLGGTIVHSAIVFLFFVIVAAILDAVQLHARDRAILASFGREIDDDRKVGAKRGLSSILSDELGSAIHTRAFRLLNAAIESKTGDKPPNLAALAFDGFQAASRQFVRALLPFLPLLGFLGTVIGLATAISELPRGLTEGSGQAFDISASLSGLAVKFETTLLGLMASMISSLCLHFLEKREAELAAACMLLVRGPVSAMLDAFARARSIIVAPQLGGEDAHITDPLADLLLSVAAIIVLVVIAVLPTIPRHPVSRTDRAGFAQDWRFRLENREVHPFFATRDGLLVEGSSSLIPVERIFLDDGLVATLERMRRSDEVVALLVEPDGHEAAFQFEVIASRHGPRSLRQVRLDSDCNFVTSGRVGRYCGDLLRPARSRLP